ncbi:LOW QUALITY PROTEIN: Cation-transporting ATPase, related [Eimeria mitis]|uniref:Cation-transporting ATPase, related n=1 Tax=Eimeria mitis TaxID=44415 RepID=U6JWM0_9EIME|nr:LOW QUALITY PROTEIN: Cation-transporting ATPase, related [Eimeria mitis]CDJ29845.1 Cation-transporting ATPase, related [Eimeria mitis]
MYAQEEAFKKSADFALSTSAVLSGICLASGVVLSNTVCGPELGKLCAAVSTGIVAIPAILAFWSISGLFNMTIGTCAESAPLFYCVTLAAMLAQIAAIANVAKINEKATKMDSESQKDRPKDGNGNNGFTPCLRLYEAAVDRMLYRERSSLPNAKQRSRRANKSSKRCGRKTNAIVQDDRASQHAFVYRLSLEATDGVFQRLLEELKSCTFHPTILTRSRYLAECWNRRKHKESKKSEQQNNKDSEKESAEEGKGRKCQVNNSQRVYPCFQKRLEFYILSRALRRQLLQEKRNLEESFDLQLCRRSEIIALKKPRRTEVAVRKTRRDEAISTWAFKPTLGSQYNAFLQRKLHRYLRESTIACSGYILGQSEKATEMKKGVAAEEKAGTNKLPGRAATAQESKSLRRENNTDKVSHHITPKQATSYMGYGTASEREKVTVAKAYRTLLKRVYGLESEV